MLKFLELSEITEEIFQKINYILSNPLSKEKIDMHSLCKIMSYFSDFNIPKHSKL